MPLFPASEQNISKNKMERDRKIQIKNRRRRYLGLHPEYFTQSSLELADPLLYDRLIRRFQSASEREKEGRDRGYSGVLEANIVRSEAKIEAIEHPDPNSPLVYSRATDGSITALEQDEGDRAQGPEDGWEKWKEVMAMRFVRGYDCDFDYDTVDENDEYDDRVGDDQKELEEYLDEEEESFIGEGRPTGQTGIQDF